MRQKSVTALVVSLLFCVHGADLSRTSAQTPPGPPPLVTTALPYTAADGGGQIIHVWLAGTVGADFLFDTGTNDSCVSQALVTRLGLTPHQISGDDGAPVKMDGKPARFADVDLRFGDFIAHQTPLAIFDEARWETSVGRHVDGVLGANVLTVFPALLDVPGQRITFLSRSPSTPADFAQVGMAGAVGFPVQDDTNNDVFRCPVRLRNGDKEAEASLLVDCGATQTSLPAETARKLGLTPVAESTHTTAFGSIHYQTAAATLTSIGGIGLPPLSMLVNWTDGKLPTSFFGPGLGLDVLSRHRVLFDFAAKKVYLAPLAQAAPPAPAHTSTPSATGPSLRFGAPPLAVTRTVTIPYTTNDRGAILLDVTLNGTRMVTLVLDTATPDSIVTAKLARALGLPLSAAIQGDGTPVVLGGEPVPGITLTSVGVGAATLSGVQCLVSPLDSMSGGPGREVAGVLGTNALAGQRLLVDFQRHQVTFLSGPPVGTPLPPEALASAGMAGAASVALLDRGEFDYPCVVTLEAGGRRAVAEMLPSTSRKSLVSREAAQAVGLPLPLPADPSGGPPTGQATLSRVALGGQALPNMTIAYLGVDDSGPQFPRVGFDVLSHYRVLIDYPDRKMYLKPVTPTGTPTPSK